MLPFSSSPPPLQPFILIVSWLRRGQTACALCTHLPALVPPLPRTDPAKLLPHILASLSLDFGLSVVHSERRDLVHVHRRGVGGRTILFPYRRPGGAASGAAAATTGASGYLAASAEAASTST